MTMGCCSLCCKEPNTRNACVADGYTCPDGTYYELSRGPADPRYSGAVSTASVTSASMEQLPGTDDLSGSSEQGCPPPVFDARTHASVTYQVVRTKIVLLRRNQRRPVRMQCPADDCEVLTRARRKPGFRGRLVRWGCCFGSSAGCALGSVCWRVLGCWGLCAPAADVLHECPQCGRVIAIAYAG